MKCEPDVYSIDDLKKDKVTPWEGVRNYQARNFMRDEMKVGDYAFFYHSNATPPGVAGVCQVSKTNVVDHTALDPESPYFDPRSTQDNPRWMMVEVRFVEKFPEILPLSELKEMAALREMPLLQKGNRLSITPMTKTQFRAILKQAQAKLSI